MKELATALMVWASAYTGLPAPDSLPTIDTLNRCAIQYVHNPSLPRCGSGLRAVSIYEHRSQTIVIRPDWSSDDLFDISTLLHMLVYHMQQEAGAFDEEGCERDRAKVAYDTQIAFLEASGVDAFEVMGIGYFEYYLLTTCLPSLFGSENP